MFAKNYLFLLLLTCIIVTGTEVSGQDISSDHVQVEKAIANYVDGLYEAAPEKIMASVDTSMQKIGFYKYEGKYVDNACMTYQELYDLAARWNTKGDKVSADTPRKITIYEVNDKTASAKLEALWGIDYFHLSKVNGVWKIVHVMWQSNPASTK